MKPFEIEKTEAEKIELGEDVWQSLAMNQTNERKFQVENFDSVDFRFGVFEFDMLTG